MTRKIWRITIILMLAARVSTAIRLLAIQNSKLCMHYRSLNKKMSLTSWLQKSLCRSAYQAPRLYPLIIFQIRTKPLIKEDK